MPFATDLNSGYPYWAVKNGLPHAFPPLQDDLRCDVAVIGGGISGALIADELAAHGHAVAVIEQRDVGWGSTAASTALLQYELDIGLGDLGKCYGEADALRVYRACEVAISQLQAKAKSIRQVDFMPMQSLYLASKHRHVDGLREEAALRVRHGFAVQWLERAALHERFQLDAPGAILTAHAAAIDPYRMTYRLLARLQRRGTPVFDRSGVVRIEPTARGITLHASTGACIRARHAVMACGYDSQKWLRQKVAKNRSSYACVTDPIDPAALAAMLRTQLWESARPYLYLRTTADNRLMIGGEDDAIDVQSRRDARVMRKARRLLQRAHRLLPRLPLVPAFAWGGTFAETDDAMPFFGSHPQYGPRLLFAMAYGGNGICFSMIGADLLRAMIERRKHPLQALFSFQRLSTSGWSD